MSATASACGPVMSASRGSAKVTVFPTAPSAWLIAWTRAWAAGLRLSPGTTAAFPLAARRSSASGLTHCFARSGSGPAAGAPATPSARASSRTNDSISLGLSGSRWSAIAPAVVGIDSTAYTRLSRSGATPSLACLCSPTRTFRRRAASFAIRTPVGPDPNPSASRNRTTSAASSLYRGVTYRPKASRPPLWALSRLTGSYWTHLACGSTCRSSPMRAARVGELVGSVRIRSPAPRFAFCSSMSRVSAARARSQDAGSPRWVTTRDRSGSYTPRTDPWA